jgi:hypothetical protein
MNVVQMNSFSEVIIELEKKNLLKKDTVIITDFDNSLITYGEELQGFLELRPEKIPDRVLEMVRKIEGSGAQLAVATNRPKEGFYLANIYSKLMGKYPVFPGSLEKMGVDVFGGGNLFLVEKYKRTDEAIYAIKSWLLADEKDGGAGVTTDDVETLVCIGDRPFDIDFFRMLEKSMRVYSPDIKVIVYKLPGFSAEDKPKKGFLNRVWRRILRLIP